MKNMVWIFWCLPKTDLKQNKIFCVVEEAYSGPCQTSMMELFSKTNKNFNYFREKTSIIYILTVVVSKLFYGSYSTKIGKFFEKVWLDLLIRIIKFYIQKQPFTVVP